MMKASSTKQKIFLTASIIGCLMVVFMSRPRSESGATTPEQRPDPSSTTAMTGRESVAGNHPSQAIPETAGETAALPLNDGQSTMPMKVDGIQKEPDFKEWPGMLFDLMNDASMEEISELLAISEDGSNYSLGFRDSMKAAAYERWYYLDPAAALLAMDASSLSASQKNSQMEVLIEDWAGRSPQEVVALLEQGQLAAVSSDLTYGALIRGSASIGAIETVDAALEKIGEPKLRYYALKSAARVLQRDHADQFDAWLSSLPDADQNTALAESAWTLADKEIERALAGLDRLEEREAAELPVTRQRVVVKWAQDEPAKAAAWVAAQEVTGRDREILFANVLNVWASKDQSAAVAWIDSLIAKGEIDEAFMNRAVGQF